MNGDGYQEGRTPTDRKAGQGTGIGSSQLRKKVVETGFWEERPQACRWCIGPNLVDTKEWQVKIVKERRRRRHGW